MANKLNKGNKTNVDKLDTFYKCGTCIWIAYELSLKGHFRYLLLARLKKSLNNLRTRSHLRKQYVNFDKANPFQTRSLVFSTTRNEDAITQISLATENIIIGTSYVSVQHPWRQKWNPELMYFSLVKLFKWTFSDNAYAIHMQVPHMQNLSNDPMLALIVNVYMTIKIIYWTPKETQWG